MHQQILILAVYLWNLEFVNSEVFKIEIDDELWPKQWYLNKGANDIYDMNVLSSWRMGYNGTGVTVGVVDKGVQNHFDINVDRAISYRTGAEDSVDNLRHGTRVAGVIGALKNGNLTVGIAFGAKIADIDISSTSVWDTLDTVAMRHNMNQIDIYSCSFANFHTGTKTYPLLSDQEEAFRLATGSGRNGRGNIYVFATGNSGGPEDSLFIDSCAYDRLVTNRYVISVAGIQHDLTRVPNGEACSAMLVAAFTARGGAPDHKVVTSDVGNSSTEFFNQNSAAAPMVSGAVALALSANPRLTYRDVMHLLVLTSQSNLPEFEENFTTNAAKLAVSSYFGFGLLDIGSLVNKSLTWKNVPALKSCTASNTWTYPVNSQYLIVHVALCGVTYSEHVEVSLQVKHSQAGQIRWVLISPYGTRSTILPGRGLDQTKNMNLTVLTVQMWGENPNGYWRLEAIPVFGATLGSENGTVPLFSLTVFGYTCEQDCLEPAVQATEDYVTPKPNIVPKPDIIPKPNEPDGPGNGGLVGGIIGGVLVIVGIVAAVIVYMKYRKPSRENRNPSGFQNAHIIYSTEDYVTPKPNKVPKPDIIPKPDEPDGPGNGGLIGGIIGGVLVIVGIVAAVIVYMKYRKPSRENRNPSWNDKDGQGDFSAPLKGDVYYQKESRKM